MLLKKVSLGSTVSLKKYSCSLSNWKKEGIITSDCRIGHFQILNGMVPPHLGLWFHHTQASDLTNAMCAWKRRKMFWIYRGLYRVIVDIDCTSLRLSDVNHYHLKHCPRICPTFLYPSENWKKVVHFSCGISWGKVFNFLKGEERMCTFDINLKVCSRELNITIVLNQSQCLLYNYKLVMDAITFHSTILFPSELCLHLSPCWKYSSILTFMAFTLYT